MSALTTQQKELFEALHASRKEDFKILNKKDYRGVWTTIVDKYPESAHFVYELLQNADDAEATSVEIILRDEELIFKHNGKKHFDITEEGAEQIGDINSITGIGDSTKIESQNKIGKFGVGFKAVFQYSDVPEVYDDVFKFKIENYIIPTLLTHDHPERNVGETLFVFPFSDKLKSHKDISERLKKLQNPLLFLHSLEKISWRIDLSGRKGETVEYIKELTEKKEYDDGIMLCRYSLLEPSIISSIFLFSKTICIKQEGEKRNHQIFIGFYYDEEKKELITNQKRNIYCFFPTKATFDTCFVSHAPFLLIDNRQDLKPSENVNQMLCNALVKLAAKAILHLRDYGIENKHLLINENIMEIIPPFNKMAWYKTSENEYFERPIRNEFTKLLQEERLLLTRNHNYVSLYEAYRSSPRDLMDLLSKKHFGRLHIKSENKKVVRKGNVFYYNNFDDNDTQDALYDANNVDFLSWELTKKLVDKDYTIYGDIKLYTPRDLAKEITPDFMSMQDIHWVTKFYTFLRNTPTLWKVSDEEDAPFGQVPIIKTQNGNWVSPYDNSNHINVFYPVEGSSQSAYNFIHEEYLQNAIAMKFFHELNVKTPDEGAYIKNIILAKIQRDDYVPLSARAGKDFNTLLNYYEKVRDTSDEQQFIDEVRDSIRFVCTDNVPRSICEYDNKYYKYVYLYLQDAKLQGYFANNPSVHFMNLDFYRPYISNHTEETIKMFISKLGVRLYPQIVKVETSLAVLNDRMRSMITIKNYKTYKIFDWSLDGFLNFSARGVQKEVSVYVWNDLLPKYKLAEYATLDFAYRQPYAQSYLHAYYPSTFKDNLQYSEWIFDKNGNLTSPHEIALEDLAPEYDSYNGLIQFLGIEKREKSILEMGGTEEQQEQMELGRKIKSAVGNELTDEEMLQALIDAKAKKMGQNHRDEPIENALPTQKIKQDNQKLEDILNSAQNVDAEKTTPRPKPAPKSKYESEEEWLETQENLNRYNSQLEIARCLEKRYTQEWFHTLLDMEFEATSDKTQEKGGIRIKFSKVEKDPNSNKSILLRNPSHTIPRSLEEMSNIVVVFKFANYEDMAITFEVASVQDYVLKLKCKNEDIETVNHLISIAKDVLVAELNTQNPIQLIAKLRSAFLDLGKDNDFSFKENINPNIEFVFGPPGTGKTTHLVKYWINKLSIKPKGKMLILCPTNKAADVIANRALTTLNPLCSPENFIYRFVATADEKLDKNVCTRQSNVFYQDKCCVISTIARFSYDGFDDCKLCDIDWDYIVIDEASMIPLAEIVYPLYRCTNAQIVIAGDPFQIEPIVMVDEWKDENIYKMIHLDDFKNPQTEPCPFKITNLSTQYRAVPAIGRVFSNYMYGGGVDSHREQSSQRKLDLGEYDIKSVNFVMCPVENGLSIYGAQRLMKSNIHIYSALFTFEFALWLASRIQKQKDDKPWKIGIISPYRAQADLIDKLWEQRRVLFNNVNLLVSTVHGFQGDECDIIIAVYNPPASGMKLRADDTFVNKQNILNVAISRAQDYLFLIMPDNSYDYFYKLQATKIFEIAAEQREQMTMFDSSAIEKVMFNDKDYLSKNTFVTSHQLANVYTEAVSKYEVRFDENSVDIQIK